MTLYGRKKKRLRPPVRSFRFRFNGRFQVGTRSINHNDTFEATRRPGVQLEFAGNAKEATRALC